MRAARPLSHAQSWAMLQACGGGWTGCRNRALLVVLYRAGLRAAEACGVELDHIERDGGDGAALWVARQKGAASHGRTRTVGLDPKALKYVDEWLELRDVPETRGVPWLFPTRSGEQMQTSYLRQLIPRTARRAGITRRVHPHCLRHTFARQLWDETKDLMVVMLALGHSRPDTTLHYLRSIGATEVLDVTTRREW